MKLDILDLQGNKHKQVDLNTSLFGVTPNLEVLKQYVRVFTFNTRQGTSSTKTRGEVSGSGIKPWKQKGTGNARVGSRRNPVWRHGGISHGPKPRSWILSLPKKIRRLALASALSIKALGHNIVVVTDDINKLEKPNTQKVVDLLAKANLQSYSALFVLDAKDLNTRRSIQNIKKLTTADVSTLNAFDILRSDKVVFSEHTLNLLTQRYEAK